VESSSDLRSTADAVGGIICSQDSQLALAFDRCRAVVHTVTVGVGGGESMGNRLVGHSPDALVMRFAGRPCLFIAEKTAGSYAEGGGARNDLGRDFFIASSVRTVGDESGGHHV